jgi:hypothetical protein
MGPLPWGCRKRDDLFESERDMGRFFKFALMGSALAGAGVAQAVTSDSPSLAALNAIQLGQWTLRARNGMGPIKTLCLGDARALLQIRHGAAACTRYVIGNDPKLAVVHYTCTGGGNGRTTVRIETPRLIQIDSQGIADGEPFEISLEGRRTGECPMTAARALR